MHTLRPLKTLHGMYTECCHLGLIFKTNSLRVSFWYDYLSSKSVLLWTCVLYKINYKKFIQMYVNVHVIFYDKTLYLHKKKKILSIIYTVKTNNVMFACIKMLKICAHYRQKKNTLPLSRIELTAILGRWFFISFAHTPFSWTINFESCLDDFWRQTLSKINTHSVWLVDSNPIHNINWNIKL